MSTKAPFPTVSFLGLKFYRLTMEDTLYWMEYCIQQDRRPRFLCTLNAALLVWAQKDPILKKAYYEADLATADSMVIHYALKLLSTPVPEPLEACRIMFEFIRKKHNKGYRFYFLGGKEEILEKAIGNLKKNFPSIQISGYHHGYFIKEDEPEIVRKIKNSKSDCLFVGMSSPLKEKFLKHHMKEMNVPICLGVGGGIDILSGAYSLSPEWLRKLGLAWFYRFLKEPHRMWKRYLITNTFFMILFLKTWIKRIFHNIFASN